MNIKRVILITIFAVFLIFTFSCEKDVDIEDDKLLPKDTFDIPGVQNFLFNIPINKDTFLLDKDYNIDFRIGIEGYIVDSTFLIIGKDHIIKRDTGIISTKSFLLPVGFHKISFLIRSIKSANGDTVFFHSKSLIFKVVENLSARYVFPAIDDGKLKLTWKEFDKNNTQKYLVERWLIDDKFNTRPREKKYHQTFEVENASFVDNYYVGEEAEYKIAVINKEGNKQDIWYYKKSQEQPDYHLVQNTSGSSYNIYFSKCKYFNNFRQYYITDDYNSNPTFIQSKNQINDTILKISDVHFGAEARFSIRYLPKQLPDNFIEDDWNIYCKSVISRFGDKSFEFDRIVIINNEYVAITLHGKIYKINIKSFQKTDSIVNESARYSFLKTTPAGEFLYSTNENVYASPVYFWSTDKFSKQPNYTFDNGYIIPPVSDNLIGIMNVQSNGISSKLTLCNIANGKRIFMTDYDGTSNSPKISSNGQYFFIYDFYLKLCRYENSAFKLIWEESDRAKYYRFYDFNPFNNDICYIWDNDKIFSIRSTLDFSEIKSFKLELGEIVNIDFYNKKIMGNLEDKILIYNLEDGTLENEIPASLRDLFLYNNNTVLIGNTIYNNNGIKYTIY